LYTNTGAAFPGGTRTLVATQNVNVPNQSGTLFTVNMGTPPTVPGNSVLVIELFTPDGQGPGNLMFVGSNAAAETGPTYLSAPACGIAAPTTTAAIGFPTMHMILNAAGTYNTGSGAIVSTPASGSFFPVGTTTVTSVATDLAGNTAQCQFTITVVDNQAPTITCPANITVTTPVGLCTAVVNYSVTGADNCPGFTTALVSGLASGATYPLGVTTNVWRVTDASGNQATCTFTVTVIDGQLPVISSQPTNLTRCLGDNVTFSVTSSNAVTYQWQQWNGSAWVDIAGATGATHTVNNVTLAMNTNTYRVRIVGLCTTVTSAAATLFVNNLPTITLVGDRPPVLLPGETITISGDVIPAGGTFVWFLNGVAQPQLGSGPSIQVTVDGAGTYRAVYTDPNGCTSTSADFVVSANPSEFLYIYPNPNNGQFNVRFYNLDNESVTVMVYDAKGAKVYQQKVTTTLPYTNIQIDLNRARAMGVYLVEVVNAAGKRMGAKRILVRHP
jgi:hypothetical protein